MKSTKEMTHQVSKLGNLARDKSLLIEGRIDWKSLRPYALGILLTVLVIAIKSAYPRLSVQPFLLASMPFIIVVLYGSWKAAAFTLFLTILLIFYFYLPPVHSFDSVQDNLVEITVFTFQGMAIIWLLQRLRNITIKLNIANDHLEEKVIERTLKLERTANTLRLHRARLLELNKSKDEFIAISSHELRTPATGVKQYLGMVLEGYTGKITKKQMVMLSTAYEQNEKQLKIVDSILNIAALDSGKIKLKKTSVDIGKLLDEVIDTYRPKADAMHLKIMYNPQHGVFVKADAHYVGAALGNILENAINFTPEGKRISIEVQLRKKYVAVRIKDEGVGIAKPDVLKIFEKFSRIENPLSVTAGGTGLRLYWTKKVIGMNGGRIGVRSQPGTGSTFTVSLPAWNNLIT